MAKIAKNVSDLIGNTPIIQLNNINASVYGKCEFMNPTGSVKDRVGMNMILQSLLDGTITKKTHLIEPTSGNTGIALASQCAALGIKLTLTMPESMSIERINLMKIFGANIELTPASLGMNGAIQRAKEIEKNEPNALILQQFQNPYNPQIHQKTTALEILQDMDEQIDIFVTSVGTGGTLSGVGAVLKQKLPQIKIIAIEPQNSPVLSGGVASSHKIQGIGAGFIPDILDQSIYDEVIQISDDDAITMAKELALKEGLLVGISSGANVFVAKQLANLPKNQGKKIVTILCDGAERYLSTELF